MARKPFIVTDAMREKVRYLAGVGVPQDAIAKIVGCAPKTLRKRCRDELDRGVAEANAQICGYLFAAAKAGNIAAIIFSIKTRLNWRESKAADDPMSGDATGSHANAVLILPDNNRDPELTQVLKDAQQKYFAGKRQRQQAPSRAPAVISKIKLTGRQGGPQQTKQTLEVPADEDHDPPPPTSDGSG
jgi:hypothetical protein